MQAGTLYTAFIYDLFKTFIRIFHNSISPPYLYLTMPLFKLAESY